MGGKQTVCGERNQRREMEKLTGESRFYSVRDVEECSSKR